MSRNLQSVVKEEVPDSHRQVQELAAFRRMLQFSEGTFSLSFAVCDSRPLRDSLVKRFCDETPGILLVTLPAGVESVLRHVESQITDVPPRAVFVLDIEASIPSGSENQPTLRVLNASRERWEKLRCPVVFWLAEYAITLLYDHAPDFWRYRSHQFEFVPEDVPIDQLKGERFVGLPMIDALPHEEKAFRASELERRIREAGDSPSVEMLSHVLIWIYELAYLYRHAGRYQEAETALRNALEQAEKAFGPEHAQLAIALNDLATLLQATNRFEEAESLIRRALQIDEKTYGPEHPNVAVRLNNLATLLQDTGRLEEAEPLMRRSLQIDEASYGSDHPAVARAFSNLAVLLQAKERLAEAEPLMRRALEIDEASYGPNHPNVALRLNNLARLLQATNRLAEAEPLVRRALEIDESVNGSKHPDVARDLNSLASLLQDTNRLAEAEPLVRRALQIDESIYGPNHTNVAYGLHSLALLLESAGRLTEAEPLMRRALDICTHSLGLQHPNCQTTSRNYTSLLRSMNLPEAEIQQRIKAASGTK